MLSGNYPFCATCVKHGEKIYFLLIEFPSKKYQLDTYIRQRLSSLSEGSKWKCIIVISAVIGVTLPATLSVTQFALEAMQHGKQLQPKQSIISKPCSFGTVHSEKKKPTKHSIPNLITVWDENKYQCISIPQGTKASLLTQF